MKKTTLNIILVFITFLMISWSGCTKQRNKLYPFIEFDIVNYKEGKYSTIIRMSNSVLYIKNWGLSHHSFTSIDSTSKVWVNGITASVDTAFARNLQTYSLDEFVTGNNIKDNTLDYFSCRYKKSNSYLQTVVLSHNILAQVFYEDGANYLQICKEGQSEKIRIDDDQDAIYPLELQAYDINGDNLQEVFVFIPINNYWGGKQYKVLVYDFKDIDKLI